MKYIIGDLHLHHINMIIRNYCERPFKTIEEHDETLITNWNNKVKKSSDIVYIVGDFALQCTKEEVRRLLKCLNGKKYFIEGDHDKQIWQCKDLLEKITPLMKTKIAGVFTTICHYKMEVWPRSHFNAWHLYAHSHHAKGCLRPTGKSWCVSVENINYTPISEEEIEVIMKSRPDNFNFKNRRKRRKGNKFDLLEFITRVLKQGDK